MYTSINIYTSIYLSIYLSSYVWEIKEKMGVDLSGNRTCNLCMEEKLIIALSEYIHTSIYVYFYFYFFYYFLFFF